MRCSWEAAGTPLRNSVGFCAPAASAAGGVSASSVASSGLVTGSPIFCVSCQQFAQGVAAVAGEGQLHDAAFEGGESEGLDHFEGVVRGLGAVAVGGLLAALAEHAHQVG